MESTLHLEVVTPDRAVVSTTADYVGVPGIEGRFGVLPHHVSLLSALAIGCLYYRTEGKTDELFISGGFAEVSDNTITILAESAELGCDIDVHRARQAKERAEQRLAAHSEEVDSTRAHAALERAVTRLYVATRSSV